jgi:hypothetical protein
MAYVTALSLTHNLQNYPCIYVQGLSTIIKYLSASGSGAKFEARICRK